MDWTRIRDDLPKRLLPGKFIGVVIGVTLIMTASFVGVVALVAGDMFGLTERIPYYVLVTAVAFVVSLFKLDDESIDGVTVLIATTGIAIGAGVLFSLSVEGLIYGFHNPEQIVASQLLIYFVAAALICTGLGVWALRHWREFTEYDDTVSETDAISETDTASETDAVSKTDAASQTDSED